MGSHDEVDPGGGCWGRWRCSVFRFGCIVGLFVIKIPFIQYLVCDIFYYVRLGGLH